MDTINPRKCRLSKAASRPSPARQVPPAPPVRIFVYGPAGAGKSNIACRAPTLVAIHHVERTVTSHPESKGDTSDGAR
jgi:hypothetical protein